MALNLEKQLVFYGSYHHDPVNVGIHMLFVPIILVTSFQMATFLPPLFNLPDVLRFDYFPANPGSIASLVYAFGYMLLEPVVGLLLAPLLIGSAVYANYLKDEYGMTIFYWALGIHVVSWIAQFIGHGKFEKRAPALLDNLFQALFLAPLFVTLEYLFHVGYRPELRSRVEAQVLKNIAQFKDKKQ
ncbi:hypothetical protein VTN49DRAFT_3235 [Thermomyces lanuginosus]|uniref:uncharacterized protein n=1 Tax=Thermomyces lanuginosus TaxID=5541 RepID=UPI003744693E